MQRLKIVSLICLLGMVAPTVSGCEFKRVPVALGDTQEKIDAIKARIIIRNACKDSASLKQYESVKKLLDAMEYDHINIILNEPDQQCKKALEDFVSHKPYGQICKGAHHNIIISTEPRALIHPIQQDQPLEKLLCYPADTNHSCTTEKSTILEDFVSHLVKQKAAKIEEEKLLLKILAKREKSL